MNVFFVAGAAGALFSGYLRQYFDFIFVGELYAIGSFVFASIYYYVHRHVV